MTYLRLVKSLKRSLISFKTLKDAVRKLAKILTRLHALIFQAPSRSSETDEDLDKIFKGNKHNSEDPQRCLKILKYLKIFFHQGKVSFET